MRQYSEEILRYLRQREGLELDDKSMDEELNNMPPSRALDEVCTWSGLLGYGDTVKAWVEEIYGINLDEIEEKIMLK